MGSEGESMTIVPFFSPVHDSRPNSDVSVQHVTPITLTNLVALVWWLICLVVPNSQYWQGPVWQEMRTVPAAVWFVVVLAAIGGEIAYLTRTSGSRAGRFAGVVWWITVAICAGIVNPVSLTVGMAFALALGTAWARTRE